MLTYATTWIGRVHGTKNPLRLHVYFYLIEKPVLFKEPVFMVGSISNII